jgi:magnesium chelatase family protein
LNHPKKACTCLPGQILRYQKRLSGPILDRIDLHINVPFVEVEKLKFSSQEKRQAESSKSIRQRVAAARKVQEKRFAGENIFSNAEMKNKQMKKYCQLSADAERLLVSAADKWQLSARSYFRLIKVGRTISDLAGEVKIEYSHIAEALQYKVRV